MKKYISNLIDTLIINICLVLINFLIDFSKKNYPFKFDILYNLRSYKKNIKGDYNGKRSKSI